MAVSKDVKNFLLVWVPIVLLLALAYRNNRWIGANPILRESLRVKEPFVAAPPSEPWADREEGIPSLDPAAASLEKMRDPYALLGGSLKVLEESDRPALSSAACYDADFQKRLEKTGNYRQLTNNYRRGVPDSCSMPLHDLVNKLYDAPVVPFKGCLAA
jgi:hypothetical protein